MRFVTVLVPEAGRASGPDLTRYLVVCAGSILALVAVAWAFRRFVAGHLKARAARRSMQVLDVLPLSGKQKLVVVRCYDRSFLLGVGDKEVRKIAELATAEHDGAAPPRPTSEAFSDEPEKPFAAALHEELELAPAARIPAERARAAEPAPTSLGSKEGLLA